MIQLEFENLAAIINIFLDACGGVGLDKLQRITALGIL
jgi:hypothetical protein